MIIDSIVKEKIVRQWNNKMKNTILKNFVGSLVLLAATAEAWTVSEWVIDSPQDGKSHQTFVQPTQESFDSSVAPVKAPEDKVLSLPPQHKAAQFKKQETPLTTDEEAFEHYREALKYRDNGEYLEAERFLKTALAQMPTHHAARAELATLYLKRNQLDATEMLLSEGFSLDENNADFLRLMAVIYDKREEPDKALALLVKIKDSRKDKNYVAFLGHIYQQTGRFALARQQYYRLLQEEPENPVWLLGVSLALDAEGQKEAALEGYRKITSDGNMDPHVLQYVKERIKVLKG